MTDQQLLDLLEQMQKSIITLTIYAVVTFLVALVALVTALR